MSDILQQLPALVGVVIGASASYFISAAAEHSRWRREQSSRWDDKRTQAYAEYGAAVKGLYAQTLHLMESRWQAGQGANSDYGEALAELNRLSHERTVKWEPVLLLGNAETIAAARTWHRRVGHAGLFARGERTGAEEYRALLDQVNADRARFYEAARKDLGIKGGEILPGGPWETPSPITADGET
jgi:hypothetical protein